MAARPNISPPSWQEEAKALEERFGRRVMTRQEIADVYGFGYNSQVFKNILAHIPKIGEGRCIKYHVDGVAKAFTRQMV